MREFMGNSLQIGVYKIPFKECSKRQSFRVALDCSHVWFDYNLI